MPNPPVWFITGASAGFGQAFAEYALAQNFRVAATARNTEKLKPLAAIAPDRVLTLSMDVTKPDQISAGIETTLKKFGRIDVLINNAGYGLIGAVEETPMPELRDAMETMFFGPAALIQAVLPAMRAQKSGAIVNISSMGGQMSLPGYGAYSAAKHALEGLSEALAPELAPFGIKTLIVEPGAFRTEFAGAALRQMPELAPYRDITGPTRAGTAAMDNTQTGDPAKAAAAIHHALSANPTPLRLQLGQDAIDAVRSHAQSLLTELATWEPRNADVKLNA